MNPYIHTYDRHVTVAMKAKTSSAPKLTVIVPVYQVEDYLRECLDSILSQTFADFEVICVNDGSTDRSLDILLDYAARDSRITVLCQENAGASAARNTALAHACGEYVYFIDSDDMLMPEAFSVLTAKADETQADIVFFSASAFTDDPALFQKLNFTGDRYIRTHSYPEGIPGIDMYRMMQENKEYRCVIWSHFYLRRFLTENHHVFAENMRYFEDEPFSRMCIMTARKTVCIPDCLCAHRIRAGSAMTMVWNFQHVYCDFIGSLALAHFCAQHPELQSALPLSFWQAQDLLIRAKKYYLQLSPEEQAKALSLSVEEQALFRLMVEHPFFDPKLNSLKKRAQNAELNLSIAKEELNSLKKRAQNAELNLSIAKEALKNQNLKYDALRRSPSMRIGRVITFLPRKIRDWLRTLRAKH